MNALAMPISSRRAADMDSACFRANSPRMRDERSATCWATFASSADSDGFAGCISHDAIGTGGALRLARVVKVVQVGYRLTHGEERLVGIERTPEQDRQELARAFAPFFEFLLQLREAGTVMLLELRHAIVRPAEGLAMRRQDEDVGRQLAIAGDRVQEETQRVALRVDRPHAHVGRDGGKEHVARDEHVQLLAIKRQMLGRMAVADEGAPAVRSDADYVAVDDAPVRMRKIGY